MKQNKTYGLFNSNEFLDTKQIINRCADFLVDIKSKIIPHTKNSEEYSLKICAEGLTTGALPIKVNSGLIFLELILNLNEHELKIILPPNEISVSLTDLTQLLEEKQLLNIFDELGLDKINEIFKVNDKYNNGSAKLLWETLKRIYPTFLEFKSGTLRETSNINFWPHHFDLAMLMFSGKIIDGQDEDNWGYSREQMNFGFVFGDDDIQSPYFYVTIYPFNQEYLNYELKNGALWHKKNWYGAILEYERVRGESNFNKILLDFFNSVKTLQ